MKNYFAIVHKDEDSAVGVVFPDLPGCFSAGDTYDKAIANAHVALRLYAEAERDAGRKSAEAQDIRGPLSRPRVREEARGAPFVAIRLDEPGRVPANGRAAIGTKSKKRSRKAG